MSFEDLGGWPSVFGRLFTRHDLDREQAALAFNEILEGNATESQIAAFVGALRTKGESVEEITGFVASMLAHAPVVATPLDCVDTCGTGGDRSGTINVSTAAGLVVAASGATVCKHGNRAASSRAGSADVLEALGARIELGPKGVEHCIDACGFGFCFAPKFHPAMRFAAPVRASLGGATIFNFLGPLANPGRVRRQVVGVSDKSMAEKMLGVLESNGAVHAMVLHGHDGLDELSTVTRSHVHATFIANDGSRQRRSFEVDPAELGLAPATTEDLRGGDASHNAERLRAILGEVSPQRDLVALNAAAGLVIAGKAPELVAGLVLAQSILSEGSALQVVDRYVAATNDAPED